MPDEVFELFQDKKESDKENIGDVILREFPELEQEIEDKQENEKVFQEEKGSDLFDGDLLD